MSHLSSKLTSSPFIGSYVRNNPFSPANQQQEQKQKQPSDWSPYENNYVPSPVTKAVVAFTNIYENLYRVGHNFKA